MIYTTIKLRRIEVPNAIKFWFQKNVQYGIFGDLKYSIMKTQEKLGLRKPFELWECPEKYFDLDF
jgi:hypothetical protein